MPTLVWVRRPKSGTSGAAAGGDVSASAAAFAAAPDPAVSASSAAVQVALPVVSTKEKAGRKKRNRKRNRANAATTANKKSKTTSGRDLPTTRGVAKSPSGKFRSEIWWRGKQRYIGTFDTPEKASAAYISVKNDIAAAEKSAFGANEVNSVFDAVKNKALELCGGRVCAKRDLPRGVHELLSGKFRSSIWWGNKQRHIGRFDTPEQASAAYMSVRKDLDDANVSALGADEKDAIFDAAKKKTLESFGGFVPEERDLPTGVYKTPSGKFVSRKRWGDKRRYIGTFDSPEQASAAYMSARKDLDDAKQSALSADEVDALFDEAKTKAVEAVGGFVTRKHPTSRVYKLRSGKFASRIRWGGKKCYIGTFDTPEQASAAYMSVRKDLDNAKMKPYGADKADYAFGEAKKNALASFGGFIPEERDLPRGVHTLPSGHFQSVIWWGNKQRHIGTFDSPEQAYAAYVSARKDRDDAHLSALGVDEVKTAFDAAKKKALEAINATRRMDNHF